MICISLKDIFSSYLKSYFRYKLKIDISVNPNDMMNVILFYTSFQYI